MVYINIYAITDSELLDDDVKYLLGIQKEENKYLLKYNNRMTQKLSEKIDKKYPNDIIDYFFDYG